MADDDPSIRWAAEVDRLPVGERSRRVLRDAARAHAGWVDDYNLRTGRAGPLDELILEFEVCLEAARRIKAGLEEDK